MSETTVTDTLETLSSPDSTVFPEEVMHNSRISSLFLLQQAVEHTKALIENFHDKLYQALVFQSEELEVFRTLEVYIRRGTLTEEKMQELMGRLEEVREKLRGELGNDK